jgi:hypothetical protein
MVIEFVTPMIAAVAAVTAAVVAAGAAITSAVIGARTQQRLKTLEAEMAHDTRDEARRYEVERVMTRYRQPLMRAAYDLQSRLFNIAELGFLDHYLVEGTPDEQGYALDNTCFVVAQLFGWNEIIRREVQFLDTSETNATRKLSAVLDSLTALWGTDRAPFGRTLRVFAGHQRAIGECMIRVGSAPLECIGYGEFCARLGAVPPIPQLATLRDDLLVMARSGDTRPARLVTLQHTLVELLELLDPEFQRWPAKHRTRIGGVHAPANALPASTVPGGRVPTAEH